MKTKKRVPPDTFVFIELQVPPKLLLKFTEKLELPEIVNQLFINENNYCFCTYREFVETKCLLHLLLKKLNFLFSRISYF